MRQIATWALLALLALPALAQQPAKVAEETKQRAKLEAAYQKTKADFAKKPADKTVKAKYVDATVKLGTAVMLSPNLTPRNKYPKALRLYREALKHDPNHKEAKKNKAMIEDIYKSMGRPIPN